MTPSPATSGPPRNERMSGWARGHQPRKRGWWWMSAVRKGSGVSSIAPSSPCVRGSGPIAATSSSLMPELRNWLNPPSPSGSPSAAYRADASSRALCTRRCSTSSTASSEATASIASLTALSAGLSAGIRPPNLRRDRRHLGPGLLGARQREREERLDRGRLATAGAPDQRHRPRDRLGPERAHHDRRAVLLGH